jgi:hypothetical protein
MDSRADRFQQALDRLTRKWWVYVVLLPFFFIPAYTVNGYDPRQATDVVEAVMRHPFIYNLSAVFFLFKLMPVLLLVLLLVFRNRFRTLFHGYVTLLLLAIAAFQNSAAPAQYGLTILVSNVLYMAIAAMAWLWETISRKGDYTMPEAALWKWPVFALALFAFWFPVNSQTAAPEFNPVYFVSNESMVTGCMLIPVILAVLLLYFPRVNPVTLRVTGFIGIIFGLINVLTWFVLNPGMWWMGVMHLPLLIVSSVGFTVSFSTASLPASPSP